MTGAVSGRVPALDGIRGVAIMLVLIGHGIGRYGALVSWAGVTVFFVLSGYLITGRLAAGQTLGRFYANRARRLLPALLVMLTVTGPWVVAYGMGWWTVLEPAMYVRNITAAHLGAGASPYAHTWSLALEEQFYLLWPLVFLASPAVRRRRIVVVVGVLSYVLMVAAIGVGLLEVARFSPLAQVWPLCLGCWLALRGWSPAWPAWLEARWLCWLGVRSYGVYLWHAPLIFALEVANVRAATWGGCVAGIAVAVVSWRYVEVPWLRRNARAARVPGITGARADWRGAGGTPTH